MVHVTDRHRWRRELIARVVGEALHLANPPRLDRLAGRIRKVKIESRGEHVGLRLLERLVSATGLGFRQIPLPLHGMSDLVSDDVWSATCGHRNTIRSCATD